MAGRYGSAWDVHSYSDIWNFDPTGLHSHLAHDAKSVIPQHKRFLSTAGTYKNMGIARY